MNTVPQNGSKPIPIHAKPSSDFGILRCPTINTAQARARQSQAARACPDHSGGGVSVDRSTLMWIGRTIQPRYFQKNNPKEAIVPFAVTPVVPAACLNRK